MGGFDNFGANDLYSMEDVWNERSYDQKLPPKVAIDDHVFVLTFNSMFLCFFCCVDAEIKRIFTWEQYVEFVRQLAIGMERLLL